MLPGRHLPNLTLSSSWVVTIAQLGRTQKLCQVGYFKENLGTFVSSALSPCMIMSMLPQIKWVSSQAIRKTILI